MYVLEYTSKNKMPMISLAMKALSAWLWMTAFSLCHREHRAILCPSLPFPASLLLPLLLSLPPPPAFSPFPPPSIVIPIMKVPPSFQLALLSVYPSTYSPKIPSYWGLKLPYMDFDGA